MDDFRFAQKIEGKNSSLENTFAKFNKIVDKMVENHKTNFIQKQGILYRYLNDQSNFIHQLKVDLNKSGYEYRTNHY